MTSGWGKALSMVAATALSAGQALAAAPNPPPVTPIELPKAPREAAMTCYWAGAMGIVGARDQTEVIAGAIWYLIEYLRKNGPAGDTLDQVQAMSEEDFDTTRILAGDPAALSASCRQANPRNSDAAVVLPTDDFQRDTMCMAVASIIVGFARSEQQDTGRSALLDPAKALTERLEKRLDDPALAARGYVGDEAITRLLSGALRSAGTYGSLTGIFRECATAVPA